MPPAGGNGSAAAGACSEHLLATEQIQTDVRLLASGHRDHDRRLDELDGSIGGIAAELAGCRAAAERAAETSTEAVAMVRALVERNAAEHARMFDRIAAANARASIPDYDCGPDTSVDVASGNTPAIMARLMAEREARARAEAALAERDRASARADARRGLRVEGWKAWAGIIVAVGSAVAALGQLVAHWF